MVKKYTDEALLKRVKELCNYEGLPKGRWILGVRSTADKPNLFDDKFYEYEGDKFIQVLIGTTNPGTTILQGGFYKYRKSGAAVVKSDRWYYDLWQYGLHRKRMPALLQTGTKITVYRDNNLNDKSEELGEPQTGWFGINYHTNTYNFSDENVEVTLNEINDWSAGCQVTNERDKYLSQMEWYKQASESGEQSNVTFCLINEF